MEAKVSVIIPIYNVEFYVEECLESAINQTLKEIEIICVDDASTDDSLKIVEEYAAKDERIHIFRQDANKGQAAARNLGIRNSSAPYIMFLDSDDFYELEMCEAMLHAIEDSHADIAACGTNVIYEADKERKEGDDVYFKIKFPGLQQVTDYICRNSDVCPCDKIFRREFLQKYGIWFPEGLKYEDFYFFNACMVQARSAFFLDRKLYNYRRRRGSTMNETFKGEKSFIIDHIHILNSLYEYLKDHDLYEGKLAFFAKIFLSFSDCALSYTVNFEEKKQVNEKASALACEAFPDTRALPFLTRRRISFLQRRESQINRKKALFVEIKENPSRKDFHFLGIPVFKIKYSEKYTKYYLLGVPIYKEKWVES